MRTINGLNTHDFSSTFQGSLRKPLDEELSGVNEVYPRAPYVPKDMRNMLKESLSATSHTDNTTSISTAEKNIVEELDASLAKIRELVSLLEGFHNKPS